MGGAAFVPGNVTPVAEANIMEWMPYAAGNRIRRGGLIWAVTMFGLECPTMTCLFHPIFLNGAERDNKQMWRIVGMMRLNFMWIFIHEKSRAKSVFFFHDAMPPSPLSGIRVLFWTATWFMPCIDWPPKNIGGKPRLAPPNTTTQRWIGWMRGN